MSKQTRSSTVSTPFSSNADDQSSSISVHEDDGNVYTGPSTVQHNATQTKSVGDLSRLVSTQTNGSTSGMSTAAPTAVSSLSSSSTSLPSTDIVSTHNQHQFKVMLLGDSGVGKSVDQQRYLSRTFICIVECSTVCFLGKTCLLVRFKDGTFLAGSFIATVGIDFRNKIVQLGDKKIKLQIFDTVIDSKRIRSIVS
jgi:hypothetical protein